MFNTPCPLILITLERGIACDKWSLLAFFGDLKVFMLHLVWRFLMKPHQTENAALWQLIHIKQEGAGEIKAVGWALRSTPCSLQYLLD